MFSIKFVDFENNEPYANGIIEIGDFQENFVSSLSYWSREDYIRSWIKSVKDIINGDEKSALIVDMYEPNKSAIIEWWIIYNIGNVIHLQNCLLFGNEIDGEFNQNNIQKYIHKRELFTDEGNPVSEWNIEFDDLHNFYNTKFSEN